MQTVKSSQGSWCDISEPEHPAAVDTEVIARSQGQSGAGGAADQDVSMPQAGGEAGPVADVAMGTEGTRAEDAPEAESESEYFPPDLPEVGADEDEEQEELRSYSGGESD